MKLTIFILSVLVITLIYFYKKLRDAKINIEQEHDELKLKYSVVEDLEAEKEKLNNLKADYKEKFVYYEELKEKINLYNDDGKAIDSGLYDWVFNFQTSNMYRTQLKANRSEQKLLIKDDKAVKCKTEFIVQGSKTLGTKMIEKEKALMLRAFNSQCDMHMNKVKWNNLGVIKTRLLNLYSDINKTGEFHDLKITDKYLKLKKEELQLIYEYQQKLYQEKEEQKALREQMREEQKILEEAEKARQELEEAEKRKAELERMMQEAYEQGQLDKAKECKEIIAQQIEIIETSKRKKSNAEEGVKRGHVYIISNVGAFGENIYKIGMTRRDDPTERVYELGNASVPFNFYIHGLIYSENAPELESQLHKIFETKRVNKINSRKEFFNVSLDDIEKEANKLTGQDYIFNRQIDTQDYLQTLEIIKKENNIVVETDEEKKYLPQEI